LLLFSGILIQINNHTEAIRQISKILEKLEKMKDCNGDKTPQYNFSMLIFNSLVCEKILYLLSLIAEKSELKKTKIIIYINLIDLSPIYNSKLRQFILGDLYRFCYETYKSFIKRKTIRKIPDIRTNDLLFQMILSRHKIRCLYFSSRENIIKNVVLLFDLNFPILKHKQFLINFKKYFKKPRHKNYFYMAFFFETLFLFKNFNKYRIEKDDETEQETNVNLDFFQLNKNKNPKIKKKNSDSKLNSPIVSKFSINVKKFNENSFDLKETFEENFSKENYSSRSRSISVDHNLAREESEEKINNMNDSIFDENGMHLN
jgi:hypothetical protein